HAHVIGRRPLHAAVGGVDATEDVPPADDHRDLDAHPGDLRDLGGDVRDHPRIDPERLVASKDFSADLQQDALVRRLAHSSSPSWYRVKRRTVMFSPILAIFCLMRSAILRLGSLMKSCSIRHVS